MVSDLSHKGKKLIKLNTRNWHPVVRVLYKIKNSYFPHHCLTKF